MSITATWDAVSHSYTLTSTLPGTITWVRTANWADGRNSFLNLGTGNPKLDALFPLDGAVITWTASNGPNTQTISVTPPQPSKPVVSIPSSPGFPAVEVVVLTQKSYEVQGRPYIYDVLDRTVPWVEPQPPIERTGEMVFRFVHPGGAFPGPDLAKMRAILRTGLPILLRTTCTGRVETLSFVVTSFTEEAIGADNAHGPNRTISVQWRAVEPLWGDEIVVGKRIWLTVPAEFGTWDDLKATGLTWSEVAYG